MYAAYPRLRALACTMTCTLPLHTRSHTSFAYGHRAGAGTTAISTGTTTTMRITHCAICAPMTPLRGRIGRWSVTIMAGALLAHARTLTEPKPKPKSESGSEIHTQDLALALTNPGPSLQSTDLIPTLGPYSLLQVHLTTISAIHHNNSHAPCNILSHALLRRIGV